MSEVLAPPFALLVPPGISKLLIKGGGKLTAEEEAMVALWFLRGEEALEAAGVSPVYSRSALSTVLASWRFWWMVFEAPIPEGLGIIFRGELGGLFYPGGYGFEFVLPAGTYWAVGPCGVYIDLGLTNNFKKPGFVDVCTWNGAAPPPGPDMTDVEINDCLRGDGVIGGYLGIMHVEPYGLVPGTWAYSGFGSVRAIDPSSFEDWNSAVHGFQPKKGISPLLQDFPDDWLEPVNQLLRQVNIPEVKIPLEDWVNSPAYPQWPYWPEIPIWVDPWGKPIVGYPRWPQPGPTPGVDVPPSEDLENPPVVGPEPDPENPPVIDPKPPEQPFAEAGAGGWMGRNVIATNGFRRPPASHEREGKSNLDRTIWGALTVLGIASEFRDLTDAVYKALPLKLRRELREKYGHNLSWWEKMQELGAHMYEIDISKAVALAILSNIDDMIAAKLGQPYDKIMRKIFPDLKTRLMIRYAIRTAWIKSKFDFKFQPGVEKILRDAGIISK